MIRRSISPPPAHLRLAVGRPRLVQPRCMTGTWVVTGGAGPAAARRAAGPGEAGDPRVLRSVLDGAAGVVHLAALTGRRPRAHRQGAGLVCALGPGRRGALGVGGTAAAAGAGSTEAQEPAAGSSRLDTGGRARESTRRPPSASARARARARA